MNKSLEISHFYIEEFYNGSYKEKINEALKYREIVTKKDFSLLILIDDKDENLDEKEKENIREKVVSIFSKKGFKIEKIYFEKEFISFFDFLENNYLKNYIKEEKHRRSGKIVYFFVDKDNKIALKENMKGEIKHYCVSLSLAFSVFKNIHFNENYILLEKKYKKIEENVAHLKKYINNKIDEHIII